MLQEPIQESRRFNVAEHLTLKKRVLVFPQAGNPSLAGKAENTWPLMINRSNRCDTNEVLEAVFFILSCVVVGV